MSGTSSSTISTQEVQYIVNDLKTHRHRGSTKRNYYVVWKLFNKFFLHLDKKPCKWEDRLVLFVGYLIDQNKQSSTVKSYISAIRAVLRNIGIKLECDQFLLNSLTRACKLENDRVRTRLPIHRDMLEVLLKTTKKHFMKLGQPYLATLYQAIFSTAYFGLFRIGELTSGEHPVLAKDVYVGTNKRKMLFILHTSKTHGKGSKPQSIKITSTSKEKIHKDNNSKQPKQGMYCPYTLLSKYSKARIQRATDTEPFFVFRDRTPVTPSQAQSALKTISKLAKFKPSAYSFHSLRMGRSSDLLKLGVSVETIKKIGRWKSNAVFKYLKY